LYSTFKPIITEDTYLFASMLDWEADLRSIYYNRNKLRQPEQMWLRAVSHASRVGEAVRKGEFLESIEGLCRTIAWTITTVDKLISIQPSEVTYLEGGDGRKLTSTWDLIVDKYPNACPYCGQTEACHCGIIRLDLEKEDKVSRRNRLRKVRSERRINSEASNSLPTSLPDIAMMFGRLYQQTHYGVDIEKICFHFLEEVGEVAWCLTSLQEGGVRNEDDVSLQVQLAEEFADTMAWSFAITGKLAYLSSQTTMLSDIRNLTNLVNKTPKSHLETGSLLLPSWLWYVYGGVEHGFLICPACQERPCNCQ